MIRTLTRLLLAVLLLPLVYLAAHVVLGVRGPTQLILDLAERVTGGMVHAEGATGWPNAMHADHLELRDAKGGWLSADDVRLAWHPYRLLFKDVAIESLSAERLQVPRLQESPPQDAQPAPAPSGLPVTIEVKQIHLRRIDLGTSVAGAPGSFALDGSLALPSLEMPVAHLVARRLDGGGDYSVDAELSASRIDAAISVAEPEHGFIAQLAKLPDIGPLKLNGTVAGPRSALATDVTLSAGPLLAAAKGAVDLAGSRLDLQVDASAPPMQPAPDVSWQAVQVQAHVQGPFARPDATGRLQIDALSAAGASVRQLAADLSGNAGRVTVHASAAGLRTPGPDPAMLEAAPLMLDATAQLDDAARPVTFVVVHPLLSVVGKARTAGPVDADADVVLARLAPIAALGGLDLQGQTALHVHAATENGATAIDGDGTVGITGRQGLLPGLIGNAKLRLSARLAGGDLAVSRLTLDGKALALDATASKTGDQIKADGTIGLRDLSVLAPTLLGSLTTKASVAGVVSDLALTAHAQGEVGARGVPRGPLTADVALRGLPGAPSGTIKAEGRLADAPLLLAVAADRGADGSVRAKIDRADWRSLHAEGALRLPAGASLPVGRVQLRLRDLGDLRPFVGQALTGGVDATIDLDPAEARLSAVAHNAGVAGSRVGDATIKARVQNPAKSPVVTASAQLSGIEAAGVAGSATIDVAGPQSALAIRTDASLTVSGTPAQVAGAAVLNLPGKKAQVQRLQVEAKGETARLLAPATVDFGSRVAVDRLRIGVRQAVLDVAGQLSPRLDATMTLRASADLVAIASPDLALDGQVAVDAKLTGTPAQPGGAVRLALTGFRVRNGAGRAVPPANLNATANLNGKSAQIDGTLTAGSAQLKVAGQAPLGAGALNLRANGGLELAMLDPILTAAGRRARGRLSIDATVGGTAAAPQIGGTAQLVRGEVQDFTQGLRIHDIAAALRGDGQTVRIVSFTGKAGPGTIAISGTVGVTAPGMPVDVAIKASNAQPITSDNLQMNVDADLTLRGHAQGRMDAAGKVLIRNAEIRIPSNLPPQVAALDVIRPGQTARRAPTGPAPEVRLDLVVDAPRQVFVRGRGVEAEMSGELKVRGSASAPAVSGGFDMRRGQLSLAGTTLDFSRGKVGFDGTGPGGKIDPTLDFVADITTNSVTATLNVGGYASKPKITLTSTPALPQDEVLSYLLFRRSLKEIGPFQIASIATSLAELTGVGGGGGGPLGSLRSGLGLDRLNVGGSSSGTGATVEAGKYIANGVYLGAKQGTSSDTGTAATLQIDITRGLKLETDVGTGKGGNQVGLTYQFEY